MPISGECNESASNTTEQNTRSNTLSGELVNSSFNCDASVWQGVLQQRPLYHSEAFLCTPSYTTS